MTDEPEPTEYHRLAEGPDGKCTVCGCPAKGIKGRRVRHRARTEADRIDAPYFRRQRIGYKVTPIHVTEPKRRRRPRFSRKLTRFYVRAAARLKATGKTDALIGRLLDVDRTHLSRWRRDYRKLWDATFAEAKAEYDRTGQVTLTGPTRADELPAEVAEGIRQATARLAAGMTIPEVVADLNTSIHGLRHWQDRYAGPWKRGYAHAMETARQIMARITGLEAIPPDPDAFATFVRSFEGWQRRNGSPPGRPAKTAGNGQTAEVSAAMTLPEFYHAYVRPVCLEPKGTSAKTFWEYGCSLGYWRQFTGDPPLAEITPRTCALFVAAASEVTRNGQRISPNTVRKHCRLIQLVLDRAGPRTRENRQGAGILDTALWLQPPPARPKAPTDSFTLGEIRAWLDACDGARVPMIPGLPAAVWWRALILFLYNVGLRIGTALELRWEHIEGEWLVVPPEIIKGHAGKRFYLNPPARAALDSIRSRPKRELIFPWPYNRRYMDETRHKMQTAAGIPRERQFGFHGLRKALATQLAESNALVAQKQLGHAALAVTRDHYVHPKIVASVLEQLPQPE